MHVVLYKIITDKQDSEVTIKFNVTPTTATRGNIYKIRQDHVKYDLREFSFPTELRQFGTVYQIQWLKPSL